jgi:lysophospholipase L1-like esterase
VRRIPRLPVIALVTSLLAITASLSATPASAAGAQYVALGDSYSSGDGAGNYDPASGNCYRSYYAYPAQWAANDPSSSFAFVACAGATTTDVINNQLSALSPDANRVSITIGGNDVGFASVMETCVLGSDSDCQNAVNNAESIAQNQLPGWLSNLFTQIRADAPSAHVVVLDYPHLYYLTYYCVGLDYNKHVMLDDAADVLDGVISNSTASAGFTFADVRDQFYGHELCTGDGWLNSVTYPVGESYHPTQTGQTLGYLPVFTAAA